MKIGFIVHDMNPKTGGGRYASELVCGIKRAGHEAVVLKEENDGHEGLPIIKRGPALFSMLVKTISYFKKCDLIHAIDGYPYGIIAALVSLCLGKKLIITGLGTFAISAFYDWRWRVLMKWAYRRADAVTAISHYTKSEIAKHVELRHIEVITPGIDIDKFYRSRLTGENFILSVGALKIRKGYETSIPAFALVKKNMPDLKYVIVGSQGDTQYFKKLKNIVDKADVTKSVEFRTGISDEELGILYSGAELFILTSVNDDHNFEGFGLVFLEAAAAGLPVVGTSNNGIGDAMENGYNGILVDQNDINGTAEAINKILSDHDLMEKFSRNSYELAKEHTLEKTTEQHLRVYKNILSK